MIHHFPQTLILAVPSLLVEEQSMATELKKKKTTQGENITLTWNGISLANAKGICSLTCLPTCHATYEGIKQIKDYLFCVSDIKT